MPNNIAVVPGQKYEYLEVLVNEWFSKKEEMGEEGWLFCYHSRELKPDQPAEEVTICFVRPKL
jgi:hypothetical protein